MQQPPPLPRVKRPLQFQDAYLWLVFVASLDIMFTWIVLYHRGVEVNPLAKTIIHSGGKVGLVAFKFSIIILVICCCEIIGRRRRGAAQLLVGLGIGLTSMPVLLAMLQLLVRRYAHL